MFLAIVPAYNEAARIADVVRGLLSHVDKVVVVDDGSHDTTADTAEAAGAHVLRHRVNRGQGAALETGQVWARQHGATLVLHFDGDGQFDPADIPSARSALLAANADILFGSRFLDRRSEIPFLKRYFILLLARVVNRLFSGLPLQDAHNGFRLLNRHALERLSLHHDRMAHATEIPTLVRHHKLRFVEFPVKVMYREYGQGFSGGLHIMRDLLLGKFL